MRSMVGSQFLTPLSALAGQHPSLWKGGTPTLAPTLTMPQNPYRTQQPEHLDMLPDAQAPSLPPAWLAAILGGISGAADAANGSHYVGGLTQMWGDAKQQYGDAQAAVSQENARRMRENMAATAQHGRDVAGFDADVAQTGYKDTLDRSTTAWENGAGGPKQQFASFEDTLLTDRQAWLENLRYGHDKSLVGVRAAADERVHQHNAEWDVTHPKLAAPETPATPEQRAKEARATFTRRNPLLSQRINMFAQRQAARKGYLGRKDQKSLDALLQFRQRLEDGYAQGGHTEAAAPAPGAALPADVTEEDVQHTMKIYGLTREQVLTELKGQ